MGVQVTSDFAKMKSLRQPNGDSLGPDIETSVASCPVCSTPAGGTFNGQDFSLHCPRCGEYAVSQVVKIEFEQRPMTPVQRANLSGYICETEGVLIRLEDLDFLEHLATPTVSEKSNKLLMHLARSHPSPGEQFQLDLSSLPLPEQLRANLKQQGFSYLRWLSICWAKDVAELRYIIERYLREATKFLDAADSSGWFRISPKGWQYLSTLGTSAPLNDTAFVAMSFHEDLLTTLWAQGIRPGIEAAGYKALRMDRHEHNNRIDDEMIALLRRCKFLVADFTRQSAGVYFEAGFALGLSRPVVWVCNDDELREKKIHFDTRQYSFVRWHKDELAQLIQDLQNRIEATIGRGSYRLLR